MTEKKYEIYDLESEIMSVWNTKDDLESITYRLMDDPDGPMSEDDIANVLIGLTELHDIRCKKLFNVFEAILKERRISNENTSMEKATGREEETKSC
jgi:hypothetical protein